MTVLVLAYVATLLTAGGNEIERPELGRYFDSCNVEGAFILFDVKRNSYVRYNPDLCDTRFIPASTFKIPNTLIALETGVLTGTDHVLRHDSTKQYSVKSWNRDHDLRSAFRHSVVWYYQAVARLIGEERMKKFLREFEYGDQEIGGGIDRFWLDGELRISPEEQIVFLRKLVDGKLLLSSRNVDILLDIMIIERRDDAVLRGKTGWGQVDGHDYGWLVGWVENSTGTYFYATMISTTEADDDFPAARHKITRNILRELEVF